MSRVLKYTFLVHAVVALLVGGVLLIIPGRFLEWLDWAPIDPLISRLLGAALLALAWSSFRGWRSTTWAQVAILVEAQAVFTVLGCIGLLRHLLTSTFPAIVWVVFGILAAFAVAWVVSWLKK